jgi:prepilin-type N-terminal cleavage/methylation domain-containing protein
MKIMLNEKGVTLIELLVAIAILGAIVSVISMTISTVIKTSPLSNNWAIALRQVQNAGYWISRDVQMSKEVTVDQDPATPEFLTLIQPEWDAGSGAVVDKTFVYEFENMSDSLKRLMRTDLDTAGQTMIAEYIYNTDAIYNTENHKLTVTITAISGNATVSRQYEAAPRVSPE